MRSKYLIVLFFIFLSTKALGQSIQIQSKNITINKNNETTIFENEVVVKTENKTITSDFAKYDKKKRFLIFRKNIVAKDNYNNIIEADYAEYSELKKILITAGQTKITTSESYIIEAEDILFDNKKWLEILGCGIVNPVVLENCSIDSQKYSGMAFGLGLERIAMLKYGVTDIRDFYKSNLDFLDQFK